MSPSITLNADERNTLLDYCRNAIEMSAFWRH